VGSVRHDHDLDERCDACRDWPLHWLDLAFRTEKILSLLYSLTDKVNQMSADQNHLDSDVAALTQSLTAVEAEIAALKNQPAAAALDFTALDAAVARIKGDEPPANPPVTPPAPPAPPAPAPTA
jgi:outer membrane murein-binding lipoprotein Lpp